MLRGLREMEATLRAKNIEFVLLKGDPEETLPKFAADVDAGLVVVDQSPLRLGRQWREAVAAAVSCPVHEVDAHNVVPVWEASLSSRWARARFRGARQALSRVSRRVPRTPATKGEFAAKAAEAVAKNRPHDWDAVIDDAVARGAAVPEVSWAVPGEAAARATLDHFLTRRLRLYENRNDPAKPQALSGLSPYLHFGHISAARCALEAKKFSKSASKAVESFFEELVVRRELADNFCWYSPKYDTLEGQKYDWARDTLRDHANDKRDRVYTLEQFEQARPTINYGTLRSSRWCTAGRCTASCACTGRRRFWVDGEPRAGDGICHSPQRQVLARRSRPERIRRLRVVHRGRARPGLERTPRVR